ncbi:hypothetical protein [Photobacterium sp. J15]|uniref:hypothetical protein n=1 Tax=Photobacterium sp. J15 TaxID=265901 RepID=UPI0012ED6D7C|nr:hypothetical protein [Photobacterium sp. J15]
MMKVKLLLAGAGLMVMASAHSDTLLMSYEEYMDRCLSTYGEDRVTESVCEAQFRTMEKKEQELMAQADVMESSSGRALIPEGNNEDSQLE